MDSSLSLSISQTAPLNFVDEGGAREFLSGEKWPVGFQDLFIRNCTKVGFRSFICDDSGSMLKRDGQRVVKQPAGNHQMIKCSRWSELTDAMRFHVKLARAAKVLTEFRLLNGFTPLLFGAGDGDDANNYNTLMKAFDESPNGGTPLCQHIMELTVIIRNMEPALRANNQKALIVIATDGQSSDGDVSNALRPLKDLPVWIVLRLCTSSKSIIQYWNDIDQDLELRMDVLDDFKGEAREITRKNPWLTYGEPLHRLREFGVSCKELDLLDESKLTREQILKVCMMIYGGNEENYTNPEVDWNTFLSEISELNTGNGSTWNPLTKLNAPWISVEKLKHFKNEGKCSIM